MSGFAPIGRRPRPISTLIAAVSPWRSRRVGAQVTFESVVSASCAVPRKRYGGSVARPEQSARVAGVRRRWRERGAVSLMGLFMVVFLAGLLYYLIGLAQTVLWRERMQDTVDAAVLTGAVIQAQAMNFTVLLNLVMSLLLAVLIAIRLIQGVAVAGIAIALGLAWPTFGASLAAVPPLKTLESTMSQAHDTLEVPIEEALEALHATADAVKGYGPEAASALAQQDIDEASLGVRGFVGMTEQSLPVEDSPYSELCQHARNRVTGFAVERFTEAGVPAILVSPIEEILEEVTAALAAWFCGDAGASPPTRDRTTLKSYPIMPVDEACERSRATMACAVAELEHDKAKPDETTGECLGSCLSELYEQYAQAARIQCQPSKRAGLQATAYQLQRGTLEYTYIDGAWVRSGEPHLTESRYVGIPEELDSSQLPPCNIPAPGAVGATVGWGYELESHPGGDLTRMQPVCAKQSAPSLLVGLEPEEGDTHLAEYQEVTRIFGCVQRTTVRLDFSDMRQDGRGGDERRPKRIIHEVSLGDAPFQVWAVIERGEMSNDASGWARLPLWRRAFRDSPIRALDSLGRLAMAQAEFYYDGSEGRDAWMWNMKWRARLRRFEWPELEERRVALRRLADSRGISNADSWERIFIELGDAVAH